MNALGHVAFNLIANAALTFALSVPLVYAAARLLRLPAGRLQLALLLAPLVKVAWDLGQGVPASSFLWVKLRGSTQQLSSFQLGFGVSQFGPKLHLELAAFSGGVIYPQSFGDLLDAAISKRFGLWLPGAIAGVVLGVGLLRAGRGWLRSRRLMRGVRSDARVAEVRQLGRRLVQVLVSRSYAGVPFAVGVLRPCVVLSERVYGVLSEVEREAALQHELAHIARHDLWLLTGLGLMHDLLWFLPGRRAHARHIHGVLELCADDAALASGVDRLALASALVQVGAVLRQPAVGAAMASSPKLLTTRVYRLVESASEVRARVARRSWVLRYVLCLLCSAIVITTIANSAFLGNHPAAFVRYAIP